MTTIQQIIDALNARRTRTGGIACCPAHQDRRPSLSIRERDGRLLVHCHAGCSQADVIAALRDRGLWPEREDRPPSRADRQEWAESRRIREEAAYFSDAATVAAEWALEELSAVDPERAVHTRLLMALRVSAEAEYREWLVGDPVWAAALVRAGRERDSRLQLAMASWIAGGMQGVTDAI